MRIAYVRVSTEEQNEARQIAALEQYNIEKWFTEKISGKNANRPKLQEMLDFVREGDVIYIHDLSRLARSTKDLLEILEKLQKKGVHLVSNKEKIDTDSATGKLVTVFLAAIAEFERQSMLEKQREGIACAKRAGKYKGGKKKKINKNDFDYYYGKYRSREITKTQMAAALKVSRPTLDRILKEKEAVRT